MNSHVCKCEPFTAIADKCLEEVTKYIDKKLPDAETKESHGVFAFKTDAGEFVLNRQVPEKQMWLSSPVSGPSHFDYVQNRFYEKNKKIGLSELLEKEIDQILKQ
ncbi:Frataxin [Hexamita inflata]|uniref:Frataxin n=1 Tax=Hexamita inflata TaxID=28002 RepID=A0AA86P9A2_9EUKA|nr:Frataxin [Hexamita inflata]